MSSGRRSVRRDVPFIVITPDSESTAPAEPLPPLADQHTVSRKRGRDGNPKEKGVLQQQRKKLEDCYEDLARAYHDAYARRLDKEAAVLTSSPRKSAVFEDSIKEMQQRRDSRKRIAKAQLAHDRIDIQVRYEGERINAWGSFYDTRARIRQDMLESRTKDLSALEREYRQVSLAAIVPEEFNSQFLPENTRSHTSSLGLEAIGDDLRSIRRSSGRPQSSIHKALSSEEESLMESSELDYMSSVVSSPGDPGEIRGDIILDAVQPLAEARPPERQPLFQVPAQKRPASIATPQAQSAPMASPKMPPVSKVLPSGTLAAPRPSPQMSPREMLPSLPKVAQIDSSASPRQRPMPNIRHLPSTLPILHGPVSGPPAVEKRTVPPVRSQNQHLPRKPFEISASLSPSPSLSPATPFWHAPRANSQSEQTRPMQQTSPAIPHGTLSSPKPWLVGPKPSPLSWNPTPISKSSPRVWDQAATGAETAASPFPWVEAKHKQARADTHPIQDIEIDNAKDYSRLQQTSPASNHMGYTPRNPSTRTPANTSMYTIPTNYRDAFGNTVEGASGKSKDENLWLGYNPYVPNSAQSSSAKYINQSYEVEAQAIGKSYSRWRAVVPTPGKQIPTPSQVLPVGRTTGY